MPNLPVKPVSSEVAFALPEVPNALLDAINAQLSEPWTELEQKNGRSISTELARPGVNYAIIALYNTAGWTVAHEHDALRRGESWLRFTPRMSNR